MEQSLSWEAESCSSGEEFVASYGTRSFIIGLYPDPIQFTSRPYPLYFKIHFNIMLPSMLGSLMCVIFPACLTPPHIVTQVKFDEYNLQNA
jgi:hypothetical protein